ncbi:hypothetical protein NHL50_08590 [Acidimicrobiia bacterium EGI L10123]|uniref:hypothetical protein n=1 Tax=Salinilacustrithrix flava TaxID=2957203 RepID=UPI003D7C1C45|nr:hypothetical protein [Acidimicrobiia bacterium EGI L10123]
MPDYFGGPKSGFDKLADGENPVAITCPLCRRDMASDREFKVHLEDAHQLVDDPGAVERQSHENVARTQPFEAGSSASQQAAGSEQELNEIAVASAGPGRRSAKGVVIAAAGIVVVLVVGAVVLLGGNGADDDAALTFTTSLGAGADVTPEELEAMAEAGADGISPDDPAYEDVFGAPDDGAGSDPTPQMETAPTAPEYTVEPIEISDVGWVHSDSFDGTYYLHFGGFVRQPSPDRICDGVDVEVVARDEAGNVLNTSSEFAGSVPPGHTVAFSGQISVGSRAATLETRPGSDHHCVLTDPGRFRTPSVSNVALLDNSRYGYLTQVVGEVTNPYNEHLESIMVTAFTRGADGSIISGAFGFVENIAPGATAAFSIDLSGNANEATPVTPEAHAVVWEPDWKYVGD